MIDLARVPSLSSDWNRNAEEEFPLDTALETDSVHRVSLRNRIAVLRAQNCDDLLTELVLQAADVPGLTAEIGELLGFPVARLEDLRTWSAKFEALPFSECVRRRCALLIDETRATR